MIPKLTAKQIDTLTSYADGEWRVLRETRCTPLEICEAGLNAGIEKCPCCGWWAESHEMLADGEEHPDGYCTNCRGGTD